MTYIHLSSIAATLLLLKSQKKKTNPEKLAQRFAKQWSQMLEASMDLD